MSLLFSLVLIVISWLLSSLVDGLPHILNGFSGAFNWVILIGVLGTLAWVIGKP